MSDIRAILTDLGYQDLIEYPREFRTKPLYRDSDNNTSLRVQKTNGNWYDFGTGESGTLPDLVACTLKLPKIEEAKDWLEGKGIQCSIFDKANQRQKIQSPKIFDKSILAKLTSDHSYWIKRGISEETMKVFQGGTSSKGRLANRYIFPIFNDKEEIVGFAARNLLPKNPTRPKWKLLGSASAWTYPAHLSSQAIVSNKQVILVESIGDLCSLFDAEITNVLVTFGTKIGSGIINFLIKSDVNDIIVALNNEPSLIGNTAAKKIKQTLLHYFDENQIRIVLPTKKDFGEMSKEEIKSWQKELCPPAA